jgi:hypothetical protein
MFMNCLLRIWQVGREGRLALCNGSSKARAQRLAVAALLCLGAAPDAAAQSATLTLSGDPGALSITSAMAGSPPSSVTNAATTYSLSTSYVFTRITARLDAALPAGTTLAVTLVQPTGGQTMGTITLSTADQNLVTSIPVGTYTGLGITYRLSATSAAGVLALASRTVTFAAQAE